MGQAWETVAAEPGRRRKKKNPNQRPGSAAAAETPVSIDGMERGWPLAYTQPSSRVNRARSPFAVLHREEHKQQQQQDSTRIAALAPQFRDQEVTMDSIAATTAPVVAYVPKNWDHELTLAEGIVIVALPVVSLVLIYILLRIIWKVPQTPGLPRHAMPSYGAVPSDESSLTQLDRPKSSLVEEGDVAGDYEEHWYGTFDFVFLVGMAVYLAVLIVLTFIYERWMLTSLNFWLMQLPKLGVMMLVSFVGGIICRIFCGVDEKGYIITSKTSKFKVNYTRKLQHFAAYMVPLVVKGEATGPLALAWGDFFSMLGFLVLIKPIREHSKFFMLQFNSLDRPEDRPNTLKWIIVGNIAPGMFILMFFKWLFAAQGALTFILVFITGIGDGLAEPVGITWGKHKYKTHSCFSKNKYTRSWEGSACVFLSGMIFPALQYADFASFTQVLLAMLILPPTMAYAEATAPHTMDTPVLMIGCGVILYAIVNLV